MPMKSCLCVTWSEIADDAQLARETYHFLLVIYALEFLSEIFKKNSAIIVWRNCLLNDNFCSASENFRCELGLCNTSFIMS